MKTLKEFTKELQESFKTERVIGAIGVWEINYLSGCENVDIYDTIEDAKKAASSLWWHKTKKEQENTEIYVGYVSAYADENGKIIPFYKDEDGCVDAGVYEKVEWRVE